jgi:hypothetical protein
MEVKSNDTLHVVLHEASKSEHHTNPYVIIGAVIIVAVFIFLSWGRIRRVLRRIRPSEYSINISGFGLKGNVQYTSADQECAWKIYVELKTRVSANELKDGTGILRESLTSLYTAFGALRETLKNSGAQLAHVPRDKEKYTVASLLLIIMNNHLRPFLSKWHPLLLEYELKKKPAVSQFTHESKWRKGPEFRNELRVLQGGMEEYINALNDIAAGKKE